MTEVEGLGDLLNADTDAQRRLALLALSGDTARLYNSWRSTLVDVAAHVEASIDFVDDLEVAEKGGAAGVIQSVKGRAEGVLAAIQRHLQTGRRAEIIRSGVSIGIFGSPNAGKSSLLNQLVRRPAAIVSSSPGTTRDVLEVTMDLGGMAVVIADTAGLRHDEEVADDVEREGIRRAINRVTNADLSLCVIDSQHFGLLSRDEADSLTYLSMVTAGTVLVLNKVDPAASSTPIGHAEAYLKQRFPENAIFRVSCLHNIGIDDLLKCLEELVHRKFGLKSDGSSITEEHGGSQLVQRERHRVHLQACAEALQAFLAPGSSLDLAAEELRVAIRHLGAITGRVDLEEVLDALFSTFCIGK